jgi:hypothetical protein
MTEQCGAIQPKSRLMNTETGKLTIFKPVAQNRNDINHEQDGYLNFMKSQGMAVHNPLSQRAAISECFTSLLARNVLGNDKAVENRFLTWKGHTGIVSIDFNPDKTHMFVPAADIYWDKAQK